MSSVFSSCFLITFMTLGRELNSSVCVLHLGCYGEPRLKSVLQVNSVTDYLTAHLSFASLSSGVCWAAQWFQSPLSACGGLYPRRLHGPLSSAAVWQGTGVDGLLLSREVLYDPVIPVVLSGPAALRFHSVLCLTAPPFFSVWSLSLVSCRA